MAYPSSWSLNQPYRLKQIKLKSKNTMPPEEVTIKMSTDDLFSKSCKLHTFITNYMEEGKYEVLEKMGFNYRKLKDSGGKLYATSLEMDFNFLTKSAGEFYIRLELLDSYDSRISIVSKIYNQNGALVAKAISSFIALFSKQNSSRNLLDYFENSESRIEEVAIY